ncbi:hypothetical protein, partial [Anaerovibrio slackiae]|uniref:hypothetical protein n=1 Tax=Anaerovibrio slackiae TaxID=2652309 RepID=UPI0038691D50
NTHESNKISKYIATKAITGQEETGIHLPYPVQFQKAYSIKILLHLPQCSTSRQACHINAVPSNKP